jgi:hypothetical protein
LRKQYQSSPGRQEWITVIECICADGSHISPFLIFKGENFVSNWLPKDTPLDWKYSVNSKGWTSNEHGIMWLKRCFDPYTKEKANGKPRVLICDGHDSHISGAFMRHCFENNILILLLLPHSSHLMQPLDVGVFSPLKAAMKSQLDAIFRTGIARLHKSEWIQNYAKAREKAITEKNVIAGWRASGLWPMNPHRILRQIPETEVTTPPISQTTPQSQILISSSPPDGILLRSANASLNAKLAHSTIDSPLKTQIRRLGGIAEQLNAEIAILKRENKEVKAILGARMEKESGKRKILKGVRVIENEDVIKAIEGVEVANQAKKQAQPGKRKRAELNENGVTDVEGSSKGVKRPRKKGTSEAKSCIVM